MCSLVVGSCDHTWPDDRSAVHRSSEQPALLNKKVSTILFIFYLFFVITLIVLLFVCVYFHAQVTSLMASADKPSDSVKLLSDLN